MSEWSYLPLFALYPQGVASSAIPLKKDFAEYHARRRKRARARMLARVRVPLRATPGAIAEPPASLFTSARGYGLAMVASASLHFAVIATGLTSNRPAVAKERETLTVELREKPETPSLVPVDANPPVNSVERFADKAPPPKLSKKTPRAPAPVPELPLPEMNKLPPPRVVGLSFEATVDSPDAPAFAVGNTKLGETARNAVNARDVKSLERGDTMSGPARADTVNQKASSIPVAGVTIVPPKRKNAQRPPYPEVLRKQGIEAEVVVLVSLDRNGKVTAVKIVSESAYREFNDLSKKAALAESFEPATRNGEPIAYTLKYTYFFRLDEQ
jgi:periplasmic protein TonB